MNKTLFLFFAIFLLFSFYSYFFLNTDKEELISYIVAQELYDNSLNKKMEEVINPIILNTKFNQKYVLNKPQKLGFLHIYILPKIIDKSNSNKINRMLLSLRSNCAYLGIKNTIICGSDFLRKSFTDRSDIKALLLAGADPEEALEEHKIAFMSWVIFHEIGHVIKNHKASHFSNKLFYDEVLSSSLSQKQEVEADEFAYQSISSNNEIALSVERMLLDLLNSEIRNKIGKDNIPYGVGILYDYNGKHLVEYACGGTHPEFVVRSVRLLSHAGNRKGNEWIKEMTLKFSSQMISTKCANQKVQRTAKSVMPFAAEKAPPLLTAR